MTNHRLGAEATDTPKPNVDEALVSVKGSFHLLEAF